MTAAGVARFIEYSKNIKYDLGAHKIHTTFIKAASYGMTFVIQPSTGLSLNRRR